MSLEFAKLANDYEKSLFNYSPELGLFWGKLDVALDRFTDYSQEALHKWQAQEDIFLKNLNLIREENLRDTPEYYYTYLLLKETLINKQESRICREELWDINPAWGWHNKMAIVASKQPVGSTKYRTLALKRWQTFDTVVDSQITNLNEGLKLSYTAPKSAVRRVLTQLKIMLTKSPEDSPFFDFAKRDGDKAFKIQVAQIIETIINPALNKYIQYLEQSYLPKTRTEIGIWALPNGSECYQAKIKQETTLALTPQEIHTIGLQTLETLAKEIIAIGGKKYGTKDIKIIFSKAKLESLNYFASEEDILNYNLQALERVKLIISDWFDLMPRAAGTIKPYPLHRAKTGASGEYHPPSEDGKEPGIFFINTFEPSKRSRMDMEATLFHELIPGHHFQIALNFENKSLLSLNKYLWNAGYGEGWALYVERLVDEMSLYSDDISRLGMLSNESLRAARLVVDTGIHALQWTREEAIAYLVEHTALDESIIQAEVDRYTMLPGQATSYMLGKWQIEKLRHLAQHELGNKFKISQFHNQILNHGVVSLPILKTILENWIVETKNSNFT
ncbi:DUF885 domain-containing protein [Legionella sp. D16C41]|uniref:DUF885 domain-containing protein n=1 Tax=Legionella sp. D16C41 TaxID=3402688 RepID=UPI003AF9B79F